jgi:hypothetical protein
LSQGALVVSGDMTIVGAGESSVITTANERIFDVTSSGTLALEKVVLRDAQGGQLCGAAIHNAGTLSLTDAVVGNNSTTGQGAALCNEGTATLLRSHVLNNSVQGGPGGAFRNTGTMTIEASVIEGNQVTGVTGGGDGGGISNAEGATLTVLGSVISGNTVTSPACDDCSSGGGITNDGSLTMKYSTVDGNSADNAAAMETDGTAIVERSTFSRNSAGSIAVGRDGTLSMYASTVSSNLAQAYPKIGFGGISNNGSVTLIASTIVDNTNTWVQYGGLYNSNNGGTNMQATIFARNGAKNCHTGGTINSLGKNVMDDDSCNPGGTDQVVGDAMVGPLADNGGFTQTHALLAGSPAIDSGQGYFCTTDQRFAPRPVGAQCDVGSFEFGGVAPTDTPAPTPTPAPLTYPMGDTNCNDRIDSDDIAAELALLAELAEPDDCGRDPAPCVQVGGDCYPWWTDTDCDGDVDVLDALWIVLDLGDVPQTFIECVPVGSYPVG